MFLIHSQHMFDEHFYNKMEESSTSNWILSYKFVAFIFRSQFWTKCLLSISKIQTDWMHVISRGKGYSYLRVTVTPSLTVTVGFSRVPVTSYLFNQTSILLYNTWVNSSKN